MLANTFNPLFVNHLEFFLNSLLKEHQENSLKCCQTRCNASEKSQNIGRKKCKKGQTEAGIATDKTVWNCAESLSQSEREIHLRI